jgi:NADH-quinone oxidoreductase subunit K
MLDPETSFLQACLIVGALLFGLGVIGFLSRRNMIVMFLAVEIMLQGISISLVAWGRYHNDFGGQMLVIFIITVAACEAAVALALVLVLFQQRGHLDVLGWQDLREENLPAYEDPPLEETPEPAPHWPQLVPAGREPPWPPEQTDYRPKV